VTTWEAAKSIRVGTLGATYGLSLGMAFFAAAKFLRTMFALPNTGWDTPVADLNGIFATWAYFGYSAGYATFLGVVELGVAVLVLFRRTRLAAVCLAIPLLGNIVAIDWFYDVRPGLYAAVGLLALAVVLAVADRVRLGQLGRILIAPAEVGHRYRRGWAAVAGVASVSVGFVALLPVVQANARSKTALDGIWRVDVMLVEDAEPSPNWDTLYFEFLPRCALRIGRDLVPCTYSIEGNRLEMELQHDSQKSGSIDAIFNQSSEDRLVLEGKLDDRPFRLIARKKPTPKGGRGW
jgi:hypothetical protein